MDLLGARLMDVFWCLGRAETFEDRPFNGPFLWRSSDVLSGYYLHDSTD